MRVNTQFTMAVHILAALAYLAHEELPSERLGRSVGTNPVVVRRIIAMLQKAGFVATQAGVKGAVLLKRPEEISLLDIYNAVRTSGDTIFGVHPNPGQNCIIGTHIKGAVREPLLRAQHALEDSLAASSLADVVKAIADGHAARRE